MDNNTKSMLVLGGAALIGGWGGSRLATRLGATLGMSFGPWGAAAGALAGSLLATALVKKAISIEDMPAAEVPLNATAAGGEAAAES